MKLFDLLETRRLKPRLQKQNPPPRVEENSAVKIILSSSDSAVETVRPIFVFVDTVSTVRPILSNDNRFDIKIKLDTIEDV